MGFWGSVFSGAWGEAANGIGDMFSSDDAGANIGPIADGGGYGDFLDEGDTSAFSDFNIDVAPTDSEDSWWDKNKGDVYSGAFSTASKAGLSYLTSKRAQDAQERGVERQDQIRAEDLQRNREDKAFELRLAALKQLYSGGSGGSGGGGSNAASNAAILNTFNQGTKNKQTSIADAASQLGQAYSLGGKSR